MGEKLQGTVKFFNAKKGFGFIRSTSDDKEYFVHFSNIVMEGYKKLEDNQKVEFELGDSPKGPQCINVTPVPLDTFEEPKKEVKLESA